MIAACLGMAPVKPAPSSRPLLDFKPVFRNRAALGFILGYGAHCFELYALRTWIVAFWTYVAARNGGSALLEPISVSFIAAVLAMPSSLSATRRRSDSAGIAPSWRSCASPGSLPR